MLASLFRPISRILDPVIPPTVWDHCPGTACSPPTMAAILRPRVNRVKPIYQISPGHKLSGNVGISDVTGNSASNSFELCIKATGHNHYPVTRTLQTFQLGRKVSMASSRPVNLLDIAICNPEALVLVKVLQALVRSLID